MTNMDFDELLIIMVCVGLILKIVKDYKKIHAVKQGEWRSLCSSGGLFFDQGLGQRNEIEALVCFLTLYQASVQPDK